MAKIKIYNTEDELVEKRVLKPKIQDLLYEFLVLKTPDVVTQKGITWEYATLSKKASETYMDVLASVEHFVTEQMTLQVIGKFIGAPKLYKEDMDILYHLTMAASLIQEREDKDEQPEDKSDKPHARMAIGIHVKNGKDGTEIRPFNPADFLNSLLNEKDETSTGEVTSDGYASLEDLIRED